MFGEVHLQVGGGRSGWELVGTGRAEADGERTGYSGAHQTTETRRRCQITSAETKIMKENPYRIPEETNKSRFSSSGKQEGCKPKQSSDPSLDHLPQREEDREKTEYDRCCCHKRNDLFK